MFIRTWIRLLDDQHCGWRARVVFGALLHTGSRFVFQYAPRETLPQKSGYPYCFPTAGESFTPGMLALWHYMNRTVRCCAEVWRVHLNCMSIPHAHFGWVHLSNLVPSSRVKMHFLRVALLAALSSLTEASLQVVPGGTWTTVRPQLFPQATPLPISPICSFPIPVLWRSIVPHYIPLSQG